MNKRLVLPTMLLAGMLTVAAASGAEIDRISEELLPESQAELQPVALSGRFQLYESQLPFSGLKGPENAERHLLKIDTVTGQTWVGKQVQYQDKKGKVILQRYWEPFEQYLESAVPPVTQGR